MIEQSLSMPPGSNQATLPFISVIMPAFNEVKSIGKIIREVTDLMTAHSLPFEIIVIDDGSSDRTHEEALRLGAIVLSNERNRGKGYCLRKGLAKAKGDLIITMDSDGEHRSADIINLLKYSFQGIDVVAGSRFLNGTTNPTSKIHYLGNQLFNVIIMALTGKVITDSQTGFRVLKRKVFETLALESDGYEIETEITLKSLRNGFTFKEVPIEVKRREYGRTRIRLLPDGRKILQTIFVFGLSEV